jgi:hypothetical protein
MAQRTTYERMKETLKLALDDLEILAGNKVGPTDASWQDVAGTCATNFEVFAMQLHEARRGNHESFIVFPDATECLEELELNPNSV